MKPKLYQYAACPFCNKVSSLLAYKKIDHEVIEVNPLNKKEIEFSPSYRKVPIYIDSNGKQINESNQIMYAIDKEYSNNRVFGEGEDVTKDQKWMDWSETVVQGLPTLIYGKFSESVKAFDYITKTGNFSWFQSRSIKYSGALIMHLVAKKVRKRENIDDPEAFLQKKVEEWQDGLEGQPFMGGLKPSGADIAVFGIMRSVASLNAGKVFRANRVFSDWFDRMLEQTGLSVSLVASA